MTSEAKWCGEGVGSALSGGEEEAVVDRGDWNGDGGRDWRRMVNCGRCQGGELWR